MTNFERGQVVLMPFPFTDQTGHKLRPAVVLSYKEYNETRRDLIVAPITSNVLSNQSADTILHDWAAAGLIKPSVVTGCRVLRCDERLLEPQAPSEHTLHMRSELRGKTDAYHRA